jgi:hypothetical protein
MKITDLHVHNNDMYPYKYRLDIHTGNLNLYEDVQDWILEQGIPAVIGPGFGYFRTKEDALLVAIRWS